jgi:hypothetical protein
VSILVLEAAKKNAKEVAPAIVLAVVAHPVLQRAHNNVQVRVGRHAQADVVKHVVLVALYRAKENVNQCVKTAALRDAEGDASIAA